MKVQLAIILASVATGVLAQGAAPHPAVITPRATAAQPNLPPPGGMMAPGPVGGTMAPGPVGGQLAPGAVSGVNGTPNAPVPSTPVITPNATLPVTPVPGTGPAGGSLDASGVGGVPSVTVSGASSATVPAGGALNGNGVGGVIVTGNTNGIAR
ncbi:MAG TPA: hypothetical protein VHB20_19505 [Verrucomicrobiae bacterium]|jgi:hypothetical protein|nr:hypothetical protein [Verrucomicrobiae bacterium]